MLRVAWPFNKSNHGFEFHCCYEYRSAFDLTYPYVCSFLGLLQSFDPPPLGPAAIASMLAEKTGVQPPVPIEGAPGASAADAAPPQP